MSHAQRTAMSHARWTTTHQSIPKHPRKTEDTKGERIIRDAIVDIQRLFPTLSFRSQDQGDFTIDGTWVLECDGPHHDKQARKDNDAWKDSELTKLNYHVVRLKEEWILNHPEQVTQLIVTLHMIIQPKSKSMIVSKMA